MKKKVFLDANDKETTPDKATHCIEAEYDERGRLVRETFYHVRT